MNLKKTILALISLIPCHSFAQTGLTAVMVNSNGIVQRPTNFIQANSLVQSGSGFDFNFVYPITFASLLTYEQGLFANAEATNSYIQLGITGSSSNSIAAVRFATYINNMGSGGVGTRWGNRMYFTTTFDGFPRFNGSVLRSVIGGSQNLSTTNIAQYPTNRAIGFEIDGIGTPSIITNRIRLIAHDGTNSTNGPWIVMGDAFQRFNVALKHNGTNGTVELLWSLNYNQPQLDTNATISGAPTTAGGGGQNSWDVGFFQPSTNLNNSGFTFYKAQYQIIP